MDDAVRIRDRIDEIDQEIVRLLKNRLENARHLGRIKQKRGVKYRDPEREKDILRKIANKAASLDLDPSLISPTFEQILAFSIRAQRDHPGKSGNKLDQTRILIVGGTGQMGRFFARLTTLQGGESSSQAEKLARPGSRQRRWRSNREQSWTRRPRT